MEIAKTVKPIAFIPKKVKIEVDDKKQNKQQPIMVNEDDERIIDELLEQLNKYPLDPKQKPVVV